MKAGYIVSGLCFVLVLGCIYFIAFWAVLNISLILLS